MSSPKIKRCLAVSLLLVAGGVTQAAPTVDLLAELPNQQAVSPAYQICSSSTSADELRLISSSSSICSPALSDIVAELLRPAFNYNNASFVPAGTRTLPAVPPALFMSLTGFLCVTLVRDRKVWLAALTVILWAGLALPKVASHLVCRKQFSSYWQRHNAGLGGRTARLRDDGQGTQYAGLLRYLEGIPTNQQTTNYKQRTTNLTAINPVHSRPIVALACLASEAGQHIVFSPAFIFDNLARAPPNHS